MKSLSSGFFESSTLDVACNLLGCYLIHEAKEGRYIGKIVETEAYLEGDPASHSFKGETNRNKAMFGSPGKSYVYFIYGNHYCFNVVTNVKGKGEAVLIRALEPLYGIELMRKRRGISDVKNLCNGPGKLTIAMGITDKHNGIDLRKGSLRIGNKVRRYPVKRSRRIGITNGKDLQYRFFIRDNEFISRKQCV